MRYGASQNSGSDRTELKADIAEKIAFQVQNLHAGSGAAILGQGYSGVMGICDSDTGAGIFGSGTKSIGVFGITKQAESSGVFGVGGSTGITYGVSGASGDLSTSWVSAGVYGIGHGRNHAGVIGKADVGELAYGVWGKSTSGYAGVFEGKVSVHGNLWKSSGGFRIDHPLDPENKYLSHSFVESPDMLNVYCGTVVTDDAGAAMVSLPDYFEELNQSFTYQLTVLGTFAQAIVAEEVQDNRFTIKTDRANVKVCWQVTGVRKDPFAASNRVLAEEDKSEEQRGRYLHPEVYGKPRSLFVDFEREQALDQAEPQLPTGLPYGPQSGSGSAEY
jgi:hypothetical protein